jgi:NAD+ kinase
MNVKIMCNEVSKIQSRILKSKLIEKGFNIVDDQADLVFIIGGDGTFLRTLRTLKYDTFPIYIGINGGNLGYLQDVSIKDIDKLIDYLSKNEQYSANKMILANISYYYKDGSVKKDNAINELQISGKHYHKIKFKLTDCIDFEEEIVSSGIVFSTPFGSTAYNKSLGGPIICEGVNALCATLFAPIQNSKTKDYIQNSLISSKFSFKLLSDPDDVEIIIDGQNVELVKEDILYIKIEINNQGIFKLNYNNKTYSKNMLEKMIKSNL